MSALRLLQAHESVEAVLQGVVMRARRPSSAAPSSRGGRAELERSRSRSGGYHWDRLDYGTLFVTPQRLVFLCWLEDDDGQEGGADGGDTHDDDDESDVGGVADQSGRRPPNACVFAVPLRLVQRVRATRRRAAWLSPLTVLEDVECIDIEMMRGASLGPQDKGSGSAAATVQFLLDVETCGCFAGHRSTAVCSPHRLGWGGAPSRTICTDTSRTPLHL
eukprot:COSAG01_NODE_1191_length_11314_cov_59.567722_8_plen_219_part_00